MNKVKDIKTSKLFKPLDLVIYLFLVVLFLIFILVPHKNAAKKVEVKIAGQESIFFDIYNEDGGYNNLTYTIKTTDTHYNVLVIEDGYVFVKEANCSNQICVKMGKKNYEGARITCEPFGVTIILHGDKINDDIVTK